MVLAKAEPRIATQYDRLLVPEELRPIGEELRERLLRATELVLSVTGHRHLLESNRVLRRSIDVVFLDADLRVVKVVHELRPCRIASARRAVAALELVAGAAATLSEGERLELRPGR